MTDALAFPLTEWISPPVSIGHAISTAPRLLFNAAEISAGLAAMEKNRRRGLELYLAPCREYPNTEVARSEVEQFLHTGLMFVQCPEQQTDALIMKCWLGGPKISYHLFVSDIQPTDQYHPGPVRDNFSIALENVVSLFEKATEATQSSFRSQT